MTWGSVGGTPLRLDDNDDLSSKGPPADKLHFALPELSAKEEAAKRLSDNVTRKRLYKSKGSSSSSNVLRLARTLVASPRYYNSELFFSPAITGAKLLRDYTASVRTPLSSNDDDPQKKDRERIIGCRTGLNHSLNHLSIKRRRDLITPTTTSLLQEALPPVTTSLTDHQEEFIRSEAAASQIATLSGKRHKTETIQTDNLLH